MRVLLLLLLLATGVSATILRVPEEFAGIQVAMDASAYGDTVLVDRGTWTGLLQSPVHSLLLCSNYLFSGDSTDIVETVLDGQYAGTILTVNTGGTSLLTVTGFTLIRGQGQQTGANANCDRGGAVHMDGNVNACLTDIVFADCRAPRMASVLFQGVECSVASATGDLTLRRIHCRGAVVDDSHLNWSDAFTIQSRQSRLIVDGFRFDGGGLSMYVLRASCSQMDTMVLANVNVFNCNGSRMQWGYDIRTRFGSQISHVRMDGCELLMQFRQMGLGIDTAFATIHDVEVLNTQAEYILDIGSWEPIALMDSIHVHHTRKLNESATLDFWTDEEDGHVLRNLSFHDNVHGDSTSTICNFPQAMVQLQHCDLIGASIHNNRVIVPADPDIGATYGHAAINGAFVDVVYGNRRMENVLCENNRVEDLDDYSNPFPERAPVANGGRELSFYADTMRMSNVTVRHSRQPNHCPELYVPGAIELSTPGNTIAGGARHLEIENVLLEDCDDGGLGLWADSLWMEHVVLKDVGRSAITIGQNLSPESPPFYLFRNVWIDNVDGQDNWLTPEWQPLSQQAVVMVDVVNGGPYWPHTLPVVELDNVTVTNCDGMRHLFNFYQPLTLRVRNSLFHANTYSQLVEWDDPITQDWSYSLLEEIVPGEGNLIGLDPLFDAEMGVPFLSQQSPCIDAGHPDAVWNDLEDPANPGFPLWPSLGNLRNDIGYTGGPHTSLPDTSWSAVPTWEPRLHPQVFTLSTPWPNPFNPATHVTFTLTRPGLARLTVHNLLGQEVAVLQDGVLPAGTFRYSWSAAGQASGLYLITLQVDLDRIETRAVTLLR